MILAMWSGPRNLSTATMYSFGHRADFDAVDEPFYACYLDLTGIDHPFREETIASQPTDPAVVVDKLLAPTEAGRHRYLKTLTHHMVDGIARDWITEVTNVFLIRHPARVAASFSAKYELTGADNLGLAQQAELYHQLRSLGFDPPVVDASDIRANPESTLRALCEAIDLPWDPSMLAWPAGPHPADGVWAPHWYGSVHASTGYDTSPEGPIPVLDDDLAALTADALDFYQELRKLRIR